MRLLLALLIAAVALAQTAAEPEIRGSVQEFSSNAPISAAEVTLKEFVPVDNVITPKIISTALTNSRGEFSFKPGHIGNFYIETTKPGYEDATLRNGDPSAEIPLQLTEQNRSGGVRLQLLRPGEITGRIVDADGNPVGDLRLTMESPGQRGIGLRTDAEGKFQTSVIPGAYVIQTASKTPATIVVARNRPEDDMERWLFYSDEAFKIVDEEYESLYWPGGVSSPDAALPMQVAPGGVGNFGTITLRKVPAYRARVSLKGECKDEEKWRLSFNPLTRAGNLPSFSFFTGFQCEKDFLLRSLQRGKYVLTAWSDHYWAQTEIETVDRNISTQLAIFPAAQIEGRVVVPDGVKVASLGAIHITTDPGRTILTYKAPGADVAADGTFLLKDVLWSSQSIQVLTQRPDLYVKEIRYGGIAISGTTLTVTPGAALEVHLDTDAASIGGTVTEAGVPETSTIFLGRWPVAEPIALEKWIATRDDGTFKLTGLAPGEYRMFAMAGGGESIPPQETLRRLLTEGIQIKLQAHEQKTVDVKR